MESMLLSKLARNRYADVNVKYEVPSLPLINRIMLIARVYVCLLHPFKDRGWYIFHPNVQRLHRHFALIFIPCFLLIHHFIPGTLLLLASQHNKSQCNWIALPDSATILIDQQWCRNESYADKAKNRIAPSQAESGIHAWTGEGKESAE